MLTTPNNIHKKDWEYFFKNSKQLLPDYAMVPNGNDGREGEGGDKLTCTTVLEWSSMVGVGRKGWVGVN